MSAEQKYESIELPAVGEIKARPGTATYELAGAAKYWYDKYQSVKAPERNSRINSFIAGAGIIVLVDIIAFFIYHLR